MILDSFVQGRREGIILATQQGTRMGSRRRRLKASGEALGKRGHKGKGRDYAECRDYGLTPITIETAHSIETAEKTTNYNYVNDNIIHVIEINKTISICRIRIDSNVTTIAYEISNNTLEQSLNPQGGGIPDKTSNVPKKVNRISAKALRNITKKSLQEIHTSQAPIPEDNNNTTIRMQGTLATNRFKDQPNVICREGHGLMMPEVKHVRDNPLAMYTTSPSMTIAISQMK